MFLLFLTNSFSSCLVPSPFCPSLHHFLTRYTSFFSFSGPSFSFPIHLSLGWLFLLPHRIPGPPSLTRFLPSLPPQFSLLLSSIIHFNSFASLFQLLSPPSSSPAPTLILFPISISLLSPFSSILTFFHPTPHNLLWLYQQTSLFLGMTSQLWECCLFM